MIDESSHLLKTNTSNKNPQTAYVNVRSDQLSSSQHVNDRSEQPSSSQQQERWSDLIPHLRPLLSSCVMSIVVGLNDGAIGFMIPQFKKYLGVDNRALSVLFLANAFGYILCAPLNGLFVRRLGQKTTLCIAGTLTTLAYLMIMNAADFRLICLLMVLQGSGVSLLDAGMNVLAANLPLATLMLNIVNALYGVGGMISPMVGTSLLAHNLSWRWLYGFLSSVSFLNFVVLAFCLSNNDSDTHMESSDGERGTTTAQLEESAKDNTMDIIFNRTTLLCSGYILVYVGLEVTLGGWGYTYLVEGKHGDVISMGKVLSLYWASLASGRIVLGYLSGKYGEKLSVNIYTALVLAGIICLWQVDDIRVDSTVYILIGALLGPMFPNAIALTSRALPKEHRATAIGFSAGIGASGAAFIPFITGQISGYFGITCLPIVAVVMLVIMELIWLFIPS